MVFGALSAKTGVESNIPGEITKLPRMRQRFRPGIDFLGFCGIDLSLFTARCPSHACFQEFFILLCPRLKSAKIDRFWFATFIYFNKRAGVEWVDLSLGSQETPQNSRLSTIRVCFPARPPRDHSPVPTHNLLFFLLFSTSETSPKYE